MDAETLGAVSRPGTQQDPVAHGFAQDSYLLDPDIRALQFLAIPSTQMSPPVEDLHYLTLHQQRHTEEPISVGSRAKATVSWDTLMWLT